MRGQSMSYTDNERLFPVPTKGENSRLHLEQFCLLPCPFMQLHQVKVQARGGQLPGYLRQVIVEDTARFCKTTSDSASKKLQQPKRI